MIKTTSFAPPRARAGISHPVSRPARSDARPARASGRKSAAPVAVAAPSMGATSNKEIPAARARELLQSAQTSTAKMPRKSAPKVASDASQPNLFSDVEIEPVIQRPQPEAIPETAPQVKKVEAQPKSAPKTGEKSKSATVARVEAPPVETAPRAEKVTKKEATSKTKLAPEIESAPKVEVEAVAKTEIAPKVKAKGINPRAKRAKVPDNLVEQYGANTAKRADLSEIAVLEPETPKRRLTKTERQARRDLMRPDEVLARLQAAQNIPLRKIPVEKREKGWKFQCGRCGATSYFQTPGGVCECGALAIRE